MKTCFLALLLTGLLLGCTSRVTEADLAGHSYIKFERDDKPNYSSDSDSAAIAVVEQARKDLAVTTTFVFGNDNKGRFQINGAMNLDQPMTWAIDGDSLRTMTEWIDGTTRYKAYHIEQRMSRLFLKSDEDRMMLKPL